MTLIYLASGLFLGWSLGANDAANLFGTAVGTRMIRFRTAALASGICVILGAVLAGSGTTGTLSDLGAVDAIAGSFTVALSAGLAVFWMTRYKVPVSTSQSIIGAIIGWNLFSGNPTDYNTLREIVITWVMSPVLAGIFAVGLFLIFRGIFNAWRLHLLWQDQLVRFGLYFVGIFGAFSLGANNIANVVGVFVPAAPLGGINLFGFEIMSETQSLFLIGGFAIAVGIMTYSRKVMETVGASLLKLSPEAALVIVLSQAMVLFMFSSVWLEDLLVSMGLPTIPLVPISSSQAVVGAILGIGLMKGGRMIKYRVLGEIAAGWVATPVAACVITFVLLFIVQNVFDQEVSRSEQFLISPEVIERLEKENISDPGLSRLLNRKYTSERRLKERLRLATELTESEREQVISMSRNILYFIDPVKIARLRQEDALNKDQLRALEALAGRYFSYRWQLIDALKADNVAWSGASDGEMRSRFDLITRTFRLGSHSEVF